MKPTGTSSARLAVATVLLGALVAVVSQFVAGYALEDRFDIAVETVTLFSKHGPFVLIAAIVAVGALAWAIFSQDRRALLPVLGMGIAIILVFLLVDLPDTGDTGLYDTPGSGNLEATGRAAAGLWLELIGGVVITLGAISLLTLDQQTLSSIRGGRRSSSKRRRPTQSSTGKPAASSGDRYEEGSP